MNLLRRVATAALVALILTSLAVPNAHAVTIDMVTVGNPGNASDPATGGLYGAVNHVYRIMKFEFTNTEYAAFLNAIDPDGTNPNGVYKNNMVVDARGGITPFGPGRGSIYVVKPNMGDKPVNFVSWLDAARVSNWLHNGARNYSNTDASSGAPQNTGAYSVGTATTGNAVAVNPGALFYVPTENEWYKAAYYNPTLNGGSGGYRAYGNGFDATPGSVTADTVGVGSAGSAGNFANYNKGADWNSRDGNVTTVGTNGGPSFYGAFDMSGNVWEWNDLAGATGSSRGLRGGDWDAASAVILSSSIRTTDSPDSAILTVKGFRLAAPVAVPEPSTWVMGAVGIACAGWGAWRRKRA
jgi:formylglycine-generating enzyme